MKCADQGTTTEVLNCLKLPLPRYGLCGRGLNSDATVDVCSSTVSMSVGIRGDP